MNVSMVMESDGLGTEIQSIGLIKRFENDHAKQARPESRDLLSLAVQIQLWLQYDQRLAD